MAELEAGSLRSMKTEWEVDLKGGPNKKVWEISVLRSTNTHGKLSYGWFDEDKILIGHNGGPCNDHVIPAVWDGLVKLASEIARGLNEQEDRWKSGE